MKTEKKKVEAGYNRNLIGGKRQHRGISLYGKMSLADRVVAESKALEAYQKRVGQGKFSKKK